MHEPIYVIAGKEESLVSRRCRELLDQLLEPEQRMLGLFDAEPAQCSVCQVLDELRTLPFLTKRRVVLLKGADDFVSKNRQPLEKYFDNPCLTGTLVLTVNSWPSQTKLAKKLVKVGKLISVTQPKPWQLPPQLIKYAFNAHDKKLMDSAAELLIELVGDDLCRLYSEIDKLALFANTEKIITTRHIELIVGHNRLFDVFTVINAVITGNIARAVDRLRVMFSEDRTAEYTTVGAFAFHFRRMFNAKVLLEKGVSASDVAVKLRIWGNKDAFFTQLRKMTLKQIGAKLQQLAAVDYAIKTGQTKTKVAVEQMVISLAGS